jgi:hypothetical protein
MHGGSTVQWPAWTSQLASTIALTLFLMRSVQCCTCVLVMIETACVCVTCCCGASGDQIPRGPDLAGKVAAFVCLWSSSEDFNCFAACCVFIVSLCLSFVSYGTVRTLPMPVTGLHIHLWPCLASQPNWYCSTSI